MALTFRQLKYFVATAELGQLSQAAIHLTISQSAVTSAIKELEDSLGTQLFLRTATGVTLTATGRRFLNHAYTILASVDEAMRIPNLESTLTGTLARRPRGENGFGYDPIFVPLGYARTTAELSAREKDVISHRGLALRALAAQLSARLPVVGV